MIITKGGDTMKKNNSLIKAIAVTGIVALLVSLSVVTAFSWYNRTQNADDTDIRLLNYVQTGTVNNTGGSIETFKGTNDKGVITYDETAVTGDITLQSGVNYLKTTITAENNGKMVTSLYLKDVSSSINVGIFTPEKTYKAYITAGETMLVCVEDNLIIESGGSIEVIWFIECAEEFTFNPDNLYLVYN